MSVATGLACELDAGAVPAWGALSISETMPFATGLESALFTALLNQEHLGVGVSGPDGAFVMTNPTLEEMLGEQYGATAESTWSRRHHFHDQSGRPLAAGEEPLAKALRGETVTGQVVCVRRPREAARFLRCSAFQLRDPEVGILGAVMVAVDVTDWMAEQTRLGHLRDRLVTAVNHEVRTPLSVIMGHVELIKEQAAPVSEELAWSLAAIDRASDHLAEVVERISEITDESLAGPPQRRLRPA